MTSATLKTIAKVTGFSVTTVSRALGGFDDVNEVTRERIIAEAQRLGYEPNQQARALQQQRTSTIGLILPGGGMRFADPFLGEFIAGIGGAATDAGFDVLVSAPNASQTELAAYKRMVAGRRVDGLVLMRIGTTDPRVEYLARTHLPFALFGRTTSAHDYLHIDVDGIAGQGALTRHLIDIGHQHIAYLTPPRKLMFTGYRLRGFQQAMEGANLAINERYIVEGELTEASGLALAQRLLDLRPLPTAIMAGNDSMAIGVMKAIHERGLRVGGDVAVGGYDDIPAAAHLHPSLTTVRQPIFEIGKQLTEMLLARIAGETIAPSAVLITPELLVRDSSTPKPQVNGKRR
jgi:DNA-binding LacI/PurR family transcriptional regulator